MQFSITINEKEIADLIVELIATRMVAERGYESREAQIGIRDGVDKVIKKYVYSKKDYIINRVIERASAEIVRKGLPKLINKITEEI